MIWIKAFHIIAMVTWFAGLFYLPRIFVYHSNLSKAEINNDALFCTMERRLYWGIMAPGAFFTLLLGIGLMHAMKLSFSALPFWLALKLSLVLLLIIYHGYCGVLIKQFKMKRNVHSALFYRWFNEFPTVMLVGIVLLVVIKPS